MKQILERITAEIMEEFDCASTYDINNGCCEYWADAVEDEIPGAEGMDFGGHETFGGHVFIHYSGMYYDAEAIEGVQHYSELPLFQKRVKYNLENNIETDYPL